LREGYILRFLDEEERSDDVTLQVVDRLSHPPQTSNDRRGDDINEERGGASELFRLRFSAAADTTKGTVKKRRSGCSLWILINLINSSLPFFLLIAFFLRQKEKRQRLSLFSSYLPHLLLLRLLLRVVPRHHRLLWSTARSSLPRTPIAG
jgi:hypothetical protein